MTRTLTKLIGLAGICVALSGPAMAYTGPGLGLATITVVLGFIASIFVAIFAILWYPIKRMLKKRKSPASVAAPSSTDAADDDTI